MWKGNNLLLYFSSVVTWRFSCFIDLYEVLHTKLLCFVIHESSRVCSNAKRMVCAKIAWERLALHAAVRELQPFSYAFDLKRCNSTIVPVTPSRSHRIVGTCPVILCTKFDSSGPLWSVVVLLLLLVIRITVHLINCLHDVIKLSN